MKVATPAQERDVSHEPGIVSREKSVMYVRVAVKSDLNAARLR